MACAKNGQGAKGPYEMTTEKDNDIIDFAKIVHFSPGFFQNGHTVGRKRRNK